MSETGDYSLIDCIYSTGKYKSKGDVRRLIQQGAVRINDEKIYELRFVPRDELVIQVGKGTIFKLKSIKNKNIITKKLIKCDQ